MTWAALSPDDIRAAQVISGATMAVVLLAGFFGRHAQRIRIAAAALYFVAAVAFLAYVSLRRS